jgi:hypothetical protein
MALVVPLADFNQMRFQAIDRVAERPCLRFIGRSVSRWIVGCGVAFRAVGEELDQCRPTVRSRSLAGPFDRCVDRERIIAVDA